MKKILLSSLTCGLLLSTMTIQADSISNAPKMQSKSNTKTLVQQQINKDKNTFKKPSQEIVEAMKQSSLAIRSLQNKKIDEAKAHLQLAKDNFTTALKNDPSLDTVPLDERIEVYENPASAKEINNILTLTQEFLIHYDLDAARASLAPLKDEIDIETISLPMAVFPVAIQDALDALNKGDTQNAITIMDEGYHSFIVAEAVIPIPLLTAQDMIIKASTLDKNKKDEALKLLNGAKDELHKAVVLGYTKHSDTDYKALSSAIDTIKKEIKGKNEVEKLYDKVKNMFESLIHKAKTTPKKKEEAKGNTPNK